MSKQSYTLAELATVWGCHISTIYRMIEKKKLHAFRLGGTWRVSHEERRRVEQNEDSFASLSKS